MVMSLMGEATGRRNRDCFGGLLLGMTGSVEGGVTVDCWHSTARILNKSLSRVGQSACRRKLDIVEYVNEKLNQETLIMKYTAFSLTLKIKLACFTITSGLVGTPSLGGDHVCPSLIGGVDTPYSAMDVFVTNSFAYVADLHSGLQIIDVSDPTNLVPVGSYDTSFNAFRVEVSHGIAHVCDAGGGFVSIDVSNQTAPLLLGINDSINAYDVEIVDKTAFVTGELHGSNLNGVFAIDISDPSETKVISSYLLPVGSQIFDHLAVSNGKAYIAQGLVGVAILDVSDPGNMTLLSTIDTPGNARDIDVVNEMMYVADADSGLQIIDASNPSLPVSVGSFPTPDNAYGLDVVDNMVYLTSWPSSRLYIIDATDPSTPHLDGTDEHLGLVGQHNDLVVIDFVAYTTHSTHGIRTLNVAPDGCNADFNMDCSLNFFDVSAFLSAFSTGDLAADFTGDGQFNFFDVSAFLNAFGEGCP